jgi:hypothetical protein
MYKTQAYDSGLPEMSSEFECSLESSTTHQIHLVLVDPSCSYRIRTTLVATRPRVGLEKVAGAMQDLLEKFGESIGKPIPNRYGPGYAGLHRGKGRTFAVTNEWLYQPASDPPIP